MICLSGFASSLLLLFITILDRITVEDEGDGIYQSMVLLYSILEARTGQTMLRLLAPPCMSWDIPSIYPIHLVESWEGGLMT